MQRQCKATAYMLRKSLMWKNLEEFKGVEGSEAGDKVSAVESSSKHW